MRHLIASAACVAVLLVSACSHNDFQLDFSRHESAANNDATNADCEATRCEHRLESLCGCDAHCRSFDASDARQDSRVRLADRVVYGVRGGANSVHRALPGLDRRTGAGHGDEGRDRQPWKDARSPVRPCRGYAAGVADHPSDRRQGAGGDDPRSLDACPGRVRREGLLRISPGDHDYDDRLSSSGGSISGNATAPRHSTWAGE